MKAQKKSLMLCVLVFGLMGLGNGSTASSDSILYVWTIEKSAALTQLTLSLGQQYIVNYTVTVSVSPDPSVCPADCNYVDIYDTTRISVSNPSGYFDRVTYGTDTLPKTFNYSAVIGPYNQCGNYTAENRASLCTGASDTWCISVSVPCGGCTLTPGYWKTHSQYGPAPYDETWALLDFGEDTNFFLSGQTWYQVMWTPPAGGDAYYILAHAYIAARLNLLNGAASVGEVSTALTWAETYFTNNTPGQDLPKSVRQQIVSFATILDNYNNGLIGPGHCSEEAAN